MLQLVPTLPPIAPPFLLSRPPLPLLPCLGGSLHLPSQRTCSSGPIPILHLFPPHPSLPSPPSALIRLLPHTLGYHRKRTTVQPSLQRTHPVETFLCFPQNPPPPRHHRMYRSPILHNLLDLSLPSLHHHNPFPTNPSLPPLPLNITNNSHQSLHYRKQQLQLVMQQGHLYLLLVLLLLVLVAAVGSPH